MTTRTQSVQLKLMIISNELQLEKPTAVWTLFVKNIQNTLNDFKQQFQDFLAKELTIANNERMELIRVLNSELNSVVWEKRMIKMSEGNYKLYNEFLQIFKPKKYFDTEKVLAKYFQKKSEPALFSIILEQFKNIFENTNSAKYANIDRWFEMFAKNLQEEFQNYPYICWEMVICKLREQKLLDFPCLNDILKRVENFESCLPTKEVVFLKKIKLID
jgi:hypothetical protein